MTAVMIASVAAVLGASVYWFATGGRWLVVETPSMGTTAPVGTLLWVSPDDGRHVQVGEVISFHPPGEPGVTYTHRIHAIDTDGTIATKGDANPAPDPWRLHPQDVIGHVSAIWPGVGWLIRGAPVIVGGGILLCALLRWFTAQRFKIPAATVGAAVLFSVFLWIYRPLVRAQLILFEQVRIDGHVGGRATYVSTGLLPTRVSARAAKHVVLNDGEVGSVVTRIVDAHGRFAATVSPVLHWWLWVVIVVVCFAPAAWTAIRGVPIEPTTFGPRSALAAG